jgi:CarboxypepD_reg-like domain/TonB-dependent Receptor Plug Domain
MLKFLIFGLIFCLSFYANAQNIIAGKVVDAQSGQPLEGAYVKEINHNQIATLTNQYGDFSLKVSELNANLEVTYIGYSSVNLSTKEDSNLKIELKPDAIKLEEVVVLQSNQSTNFSSLSKIDLALKPIKNSQELLKIVPGLFVAQHAGGGKAEQIFLRGFDCDHGTDIQVSVDGMLVNMVSHAHGQGYADAHFIIPETINKVDFGAGPYYTQHGNLNTAGYVSFATYDNIPQSKIQIEAGQFNTKRVLTMIDLLKKNKEKQSAYIASEYNYADGATINEQNFNRFNIFGKYNLSIFSKTQLTASLSAFKSKWNASGQVPTRAVEDGTIDRFGSIDPSEGGNTERYNANLMVAHNFGNDMVWENQAYISRYHFNLYSNFTFYLNDPVNGDEINQRENRNVFGFLSKINKQNDVGGFSINSIYGIGFRHDMTQNSQLSRVVKREFLENIKLGDIQESNAFAYVQQQISKGEWLFEGGLRLDYLHFNYFDKLNPEQLPAQGKAIFSPKFNTQYTFNSKIQAYLKAGKGFHSNDTRVVVANEGKEILPAAYGVDFGLILKPTPNLLLNVAAWYLFLDQEFVYVGDDGVIEPSGKSRREGIDIIARYQFSKNLFANMNINITKPRAVGLEEGQNCIPLAPVATSTGGIFYKNKEGLSGGLSYRLIKNRPANEDNSIEAKGYFLADASVNYTKKKYEVGLSAENLFNVKWNEAQFATESRLKNEPVGSSVTELNFTPGTPLFIKAKFAILF